MPEIRFSVFDHLDAAAETMAHQYEQRLQLAEACDAAGFFAYHVAEHHSTPHGIAPSPNLFLSALAQRTSRLRLGPLVMLLNLYHPLRAFEEICMLDQLSGGRLEVGIGSGMSLELGFFGIEADLAQGRYAEASEIILKALAGGPLNYPGQYFDLRDVPVALTPFQRPSPPLWVGVTQPKSAVFAAEKGMNMACVGGVEVVRAATDAFRACWQLHPTATTNTLPNLGMVRQIVIADTDAEARTLAESAYEHWFESFVYLSRQRGLPIPAILPQTFQEAASKGFSIAGSMLTVRDALAEQIPAAGINYLLCQIAFGNLPLNASLRTAAAIGSSIIPFFMDEADEDEIPVLAAA
jgi:alkanesulfonate monooxygenase SsuD/methylene tetrahydromethanopterin reductase-like flavin-dependent oxidoreductase (luciferase family)